MRPQRLILSVCATVACAALFFGCSRRDDSRAALVSGAAVGSAHAVRTTVLGDSLALGIGATDSAHGFAFDLYRRIDADRPGSEITNLAIGGTTASDVARLEVSRIAATRPDIVLLEVGANDAVRRRAADRFADDFETLLAAVKRAAPRARIVVFNVPDVAVSPIFEDASKPALRRLVVSYNAAVTRASKKDGATVVDLYRISDRARDRSSDRFFSSDLFHPSDLGHRDIADSAWPAVRSIVSGIR